MKLYIDDNVAGPMLMAMLGKAGHSVIGPSDVGLSGAKDPKHLEFAIKQSSAVLTRDGEDFDDLHWLLQTAGGKYFGILVVRSDKDPKHDMKPKHWLLPSTNSNNLAWT